MEKNKQDLPYDLRPSRSGPAVLKGLFPTQSSLDSVQISSYEDHLKNHTQKSSKTGSVDSLLLVVFDQVYSNLSNMLNNLAGPPPSASNNMSDFTFLLDSEGGGGLCFQTLYEQQQQQQQQIPSDKTARSE